MNHRRSLAAVAILAAVGFAACGEAATPHHDTTNPQPSATQAAGPPDTLRPARDYRATHPEPTCRRSRRPSAGTGRWANLVAIQESLLRRRPALLPMTADALRSANLEAQDLLRAPASRGASCSPMRSASCRGRRAKGAPYRRAQALRRVNISGNPRWFSGGRASVPPPPSSGYGRDRPGHPASATPALVASTPRSAFQGAENWPPTSRVRVGRRSPLNPHSADLCVIARGMGGAVPSVPH